VTTLDELEKLLAEATQGEWYRSNDMVFVVGEDRPVAECEPVEGYFRKHHANAALIVAAVNALPAHLARIAELEAALKFYAERGHYSDVPVAGMAFQYIPAKAVKDGGKIARAALSGGKP
jgi:hypothetical protein